MSGSRGTIRDIEILRAIAVVFVLFQHTRGILLPKDSVEGHWWTLFGGGWVGVDLFFCISGFVIARTLLERFERVQGSASFGRMALAFWTARLFRLAPSAWLWLALILVLCMFWNSSGVFGDLETNLWWTLSGVLNFSNYLFVQYFGEAKPGASFVYWSLSLEEQFYLVFPFLLWVSRRYLAWVLLALVALQLFSFRGLYGMMFRTDAIALGVLVALARYREVGLWRYLDSLPRPLVMAIVMGLMYSLLAVGSQSQKEMHFQVGLVALLSVSCVALCSGQKDQLYVEGRVAHVLLWLGARSYAIYLIHIPAMFATRELFYRLGWPVADNKVLAALVCSSLLVASAACNYRWVEQPARRFGRRLADRLDRTRTTEIPPLLKETERAIP